jgi:hypothetical protein
LNIRKPRCLPALAGLGLLLAAEAVPARAVPQAEVEARVDLGLDQQARHYVRPEIRFLFPLPSSRLFLGTIYEQHLNDRWQGSADLWVKAGLSVPLGPAWEVEAGLNHLCRHSLSLPGSYVLSVNEVLVRARHRRGGLKLGLGLGTYLHSSAGIFPDRRPLHSLAAADAALETIGGSFLSLKLGLKLVDFSRLLHDLELRARLGRGAYLFLRNVTAYDSPNPTDLGLGYEADPADQGDEGAVSFVSSLVEFLPWDDSHKLLIGQDVAFDLVRSSRQRIALRVGVDVPVFRGEKMLGLFRPEKLKYPLGLEYERRLTPGAFLFGYGAFEVTMPVDTVQHLTSSLGLGLGLRNQRFFQALSKPLRYELSLGLNSVHDYDALASFGLNTVRAKPDFGLEAMARLNSRAQQAHLAGFIEFGRRMKYRFLLGGDWLRDETPRPSVRTRVWVGFEFYILFAPENAVRGPSPRARP